MGDFEHRLSEADAVWHPYTKNSACRAGLPVMVRGEGPYLFDDRGDRYVDAVSSWWACSLGHGHPEIVPAIQEQASVLQHSILGGLTHPPARKLAARLAALMPDQQRHVHFASDGASAVEAAMKIAIQYWSNRGEPKKSQFVSLQGAYHGDTLATVALGYQEAFHRPFAGIRPPARQLPTPPYDDSPDGALKTAAEILAAHGAETAALVVEPMCQGAAGMRVYPASFLAALHELCRAHDILFVADEVATGFYRTGRRFAFEHAGIDPDIVCVGKALSAGYLPISAAIVRDEIFDTFGDQPEDHTFYHGHTFAGNPVAAAAALAAIAIYEHEGFAARVQAGSTVMHDVLRPLSGRPGVADVRGLGMIAAVELASTPGGGSGAARAQKVRERMFLEKVLIRPLGSVVYLMPPLNTPGSLIQRVAQMLKEAIVSAR